MDPVKNQVSENPFDKLLDEFRMEVVKRHGLDDTAANACVYFISRAHKAGLAGREVTAVQAEYLKSGTHRGLTQQAADACDPFIESAWRLGEQERNMYGRRS